MNNKNEQLDIVRTTLLSLHEALLLFERRQFEAVYGRIQNTHQYLSIVMEHPSFEWLKSLSALITTIDEFTDNEETTTSLTEIIMYIDLLLTPSETGTSFTQKYFVAIQKDPDVLIAHTKAKQAIAILKDHTS